MGPRALIFWSTLAVATAAGAVYSSLEANRSVVTAASLDTPVFETLVAAPETVASIAIEHGGERFTVERGEGGWTVPERFGYAADESAVRDLVTGLADLRYAAPRTRLPERFVRLDVDPPGAESAAVRVTLTADDGGVLADAILGKRSQAITQAQRGTYLRLPDGERAWLASGTVEAPTDIADWLDTGLASIARDDLEVLQVAPAAGEGFTLGRLAAADDLTLTDQLAPDQTADAAAIRRLVGALASLRFDEVLPAADVAWPESWSTIEGTAFDGTTLELHLATVDEERWVRFGAEAPWAYRLPDFQLNRLDVTLDDLLAAPEAS